MKRIVIKVTLKGQKSRSKAMEVVGSLAGVGSVAFAGQDSNHIVVTGDGIDAVELTKLLRKKVGSTEIVSVGPVEYGGDSYGMVQFPVAAYNSYPNGYGSGQGYGYDSRNQNLYSYSYGPGDGYDTKNQNQNPNSNSYGSGYGYDTSSYDQNPNCCSIL